MKVEDGDELEDDGTEAVELRDWWGDIIARPSAERVKANKAWAKRLADQAKAKEEGR